MDYTQEQKDTIINYLFETGKEKLEGNTSLRMRDIYALFFTQELDSFGAKDKADELDKIYREVFGMDDGDN